MAYRVKYTDLVGQRFGRLLVTAHVSDPKRPGRTTWRCVCDCGRTTHAQGSFLAHGQIKSCGCLAKRNAVKHGHIKGKVPSPTYSSWSAAKRRCDQPRNINYKNYGGRGIRMCERWRTNFSNFLADMGIKPPGTSLDRFPNPDGNYEPGNCRWASRAEQRGNRGNDIRPFCPVCNRKLPRGITLLKPVVAGSLNLESKTG